DWAGVEYHEVLYKSDRIPLHYEWAERLLATGEAYVCECDAETLRKNREAMRACVHRVQDVDETIAMWKAMLAGEYGEGEAVVRLKTDMADPNPAFRDRVLFRIAEREHPRRGTPYRVWPIDAFLWAAAPALRGRGIRPAALREFVLSFGLSLNDIEVAAETLYAENRKMIDKDANRYFFVPDPVPIEIAGLPPVERVKAPLHPDFPGRGVREI